jgi:hypothetical protein
MPHKEKKKYKFTLNSLPVYPSKLPKLAIFFCIFSHAQASCLRYTKKVASGRKKALVLLRPGLLTVVD